MNVIDSFWILLFSLLPYLLKTTFKISIQNISLSLNPLHVMSLNLSVSENKMHPTHIDVIRIAHTLKHMISKQTKFGNSFAIQKRGRNGIRTRVRGFKVPGANRYTIQPLITTIS